MNADGHANLIPETLEWPAGYNEIPKEVFIRPDIFEQETKTIFHGAQWHPVAQ